MRQTLYAAYKEPRGDRGVASAQEEFGHLVDAQHEVERAAEIAARLGINLLDLNVSISRVWSEMEAAGDSLAEYARLRSGRNLDYEIIRRCCVA